LRILKSDGAVQVIRAAPKIGCGILSRGHGRLSELKIDTTINTTPNEVELAIPFDEDDKHRSTIQNMQIGFGASAAKRPRISRIPAHGSAANAVRCIFSGAALISR